MTKILSILGSILFVLVIVLSVRSGMHMGQEAREEASTRRYLSPCQCKMEGGCVISFTPLEGTLFADGTDPADYDKWGQYSGPVEVPKPCRGD